MDDEEVDTRIRSFFWPIPLEEIEENAQGKPVVSINFTASRWVPTTLLSALKWLNKHENAASLRQQDKTFAIVKCQTSPTWEERFPEDEEIPPIPEDWFEPPVVHDQTTEDNTPIETIEGYRGALLPKNFKHTLMIGNIDAKNIWTPRKKQFKQLEISTMSPEDIIAISAVELFEDEIFATDGDTPIEHGPMDQRMGSISNDECYTCGNRYDDLVSAKSCPGHFGHIVLATPVPNFLFLQGNGYVANPNSPLSFVVNHVCHHCNEVRLTDEQMEELDPYIDTIAKKDTNEYGLTQIRNLVKAKAKVHTSKENMKNKLYHCPRCGKDSPLLEWNHMAKLWLIKTPKKLIDGAVNIQMDAVYSMLENIPTKFNKYLGFFGQSKPADMYWTVLPVAPITARPLAYDDDGNPEPNDLTVLYQNIIEQNNQIIRRRQTNADSSLLAQFAKELYKRCTHLVTGSNAALGAGGQRSIRDRKGKTRMVAYKGLLDRLTGGKRKTRMRSVIQSKVVDYVSYSVVTPNPDLDIDQVGVPYHVCVNTTVEEEVTAENIERLQEMVINGKPDIPKAYKEYKQIAHYVVRGGFHKNEVTDFEYVRRVLDDVSIDKLEDAWRDYKYENEINLTGVEENKINEMKKEFARQWNRTNRATYAELEIGDKVGRSLQEGDIGLFNRAPSLHRQSIMAMKVVPMNQKSLSFNPTICIPFNADYDGDAMKLHFVQSEKAIQQSKERMALGKNIIHARYGKLTIATDQDQTTGLAILTMPIATKKGEYSNGLGYTKEEGIPFFNKARACNFLSAAWDRQEDGSIEYMTELPEPDYKLDGKDYWTGRAIVSALLPNFLNATFEGNNPLRNEEGQIVRINKDKQLYNGQFATKEVKEIVNIRNGVLLNGTLDKNAFGEGGASIAPAFFYRYGYDKGQEELVKFINKFTRLAFEAHKQIGFTINVSDCSMSLLDVRQPINEQYEMVSKQIMKIQKAYDNRTLHELPDLTPADQTQILSDPLTWAESKMVELADEYESVVTDLVSDAAGPSNPIQIAVRSKARGSTTNIQQMSASYGQVKYGGRRPIWGVSTKRTMSHYPINGTEPEHPRNKGFVESCYGIGLEPDEYWLTSTAGRRSAAESSTGAIAKSGHLEYKVKRSIEDVVVGESNNAVDVRTGTVVSFNLGGDGLRPFHIRGKGHDTLSPDGRVITLQPLLFDFNCKHGKSLMDECDQCSKSLNVDYIFEQTSFAHASASFLASKIEGREILKAEANKLIDKFSWWFAESQCEIGEAIGATAASCLGEPVTQAGLRTFHGGGKFSVQGSVEGIERLVQISKSGNPDAMTTIYLKKQYDFKDAESVAQFCTQNFLGEFITSVQYKDDKSLIVAVDPVNIERQQIDRGFAERQISRVMSDFIIEKNLIDNDEFIITMDSPDPRKLLLARDRLKSIQVSGLSNAIFAIPEEPKKKGLGAGLFRVKIRGPIHSGDSAVLWDEIHELLEQYIEPEFSWTTEFWVIYKRFGLEAMLSCLYEQIDEQMNGSNGLGEYDHRYIQTLVDRIGQKGYPVALTPNNGWGGAHNPSFVGAIAGEAIVPKIAAGATMNSKDELRGMVEAVTTGNTARIGPDYTLD